MIINNKTLVNQNTFVKRVKKLREKHGLLQRQMAPLFGIDYVMYQKVESGRYDWSEDTLKEKLMLLATYEKERDLKKYISGVHVSSVGKGRSGEQLQLLLEECKTLRADLESYKEQNKALTTSINFYAEERKKDKVRIEELERQLQEERTKRF